MASGPKGANRHHSRAREFKGKRLGNGEILRQIFPSAASSLAGVAGSVFHRHLCSIALKGLAGRARLVAVLFADGPYSKHIVYILKGGKTKFSFPDGTTKESAVKAGQAVIRPPVTHSQESMSPVHGIVIELKK